MVKAKGLRTKAPLVYVLEFRFRNQKLQYSWPRRRGSSSPCSIRRPQDRLRALPQWWGCDLLTHSTNSNAWLSSRIPLQIPPEWMIDPRTGHHLIVKLTHKFNPSVCFKQMQPNNISLPRIQRLRLLILGRRGYGAGIIALGRAHSFPLQWIY